MTTEFDVITQEDERRFLEFSSTLSLPVDDHRTDFIIAEIRENFFHNCNAWCLQREMEVVFQCVFRSVKQKKGTIASLKILLDVATITYILRDLCYFRNFDLECIRSLKDRIGLLSVSGITADSLSVLLFTQICVNVANTYLPRSLSVFFEIIDAQRTRETIACMFYEVVKNSDAISIAAIETISDRIFSAKIKGRVWALLMGDVIFSIGFNLEHKQKKKLFWDHQNTDSGSWNFLPLLLNTWLYDPQNETALALEERKK